MSGAYNHTLSSTYVEDGTKFGINYGIGFASGFLSRDTLRIAEFEIKNQLFAEATAEDS